VATGLLARTGVDDQTGRVVRIVRTGSSGATVRIVERPDGSQVAVKTARNPRVSATAQARARATIEPFIGDRLPAVLFAGTDGVTDVLIAECPSPTTLADVVAEGHAAPTITAVWDEITVALTEVWTASARPGYAHDLATRNHKRRLARAVEGLQFAARFLDMPVAQLQSIVANDVAYGSWQSAHDRLRALPLPGVHVACQGDPQPRNILLSENLRWHLIDWEWSGLHHDWRMLISHLIGWWYVDRLASGGSGQISSTLRGVALTYEAPAPTPAAWAAPVVRAFNTMTGSARRDHDLAALCLHTALLLLREIPRAIRQRRQHVISPLLGEAMRLIDGTSTGEPHPVIRPFVATSPSEGHHA